MTQNNTVEYKPEAQVLFVKQFQKQGEQNFSDNVIKASGEDVESISITLTVKNSPGTFTLVLSNATGKFMVADNPEEEIIGLYKGSKRSTVRSSTGQKVITRTKIKGEGSTTSINKTLADAIAAGTSNVTIQKLQEDAREIDAKVASLYPFENFEQWKNHVNFTVESIEETSDDFGSRYVVKEIRDEDTGFVKERWALDNVGRVIYVSDSITAAELEKYMQDGTSVEVSLKVLDIEHTNKAQAKEKLFLLRWHYNSDFLTKYKDTDIQGTVLNTFERGRCKIAPMDKVVIFLSERFPTSVKRQNLARAFTGVVSSVQDGWAGNHATITIQGEDVTKYLQLSIINVNPALLLDRVSLIDQDPTAAITLWSNIFKTKKIPDIIKYVLLGSEGVEGSLGGKNKILGIGYYKIARTSTGQDIKYDPIADKYILEDATKAKGGQNIFSFKEVLGELFTEHAVHIINPYRSGTKLLGFRAYELELQNSWSFYQADFKTRREIAYRAAEDSHFVFYADRFGHVWFRPPYFDAGHILGAKNPKIWIIDKASIISYGLIEDESQVYSSVYVTTEPEFALGELAQIGYYTGSYRDDVIVLKYGQRFFTYSNPVIRVGGGNKNNIVAYAKSLLQRILAGQYQGQITITGRVELEPGYPIYLPERNRIYYVETIDHSFDFGGSFQTTIHVSYGRKPWEHLAELLTFSEKDDMYLTDGQILAQIYK